MKEISIIIPILNEQDNIPGLLGSLDEFLADREEKYQVIFVDDGSSDESVSLLKNIRTSHYTSKIISLSKNFGSHAALRAGILHARGDFICFIYADLQDPLYLIDKLYEEVSKGHDVCWATRSHAKNGFFERVFSKTYSLLMRRYAIKEYPEKGFDIVMFSKKAQVLLNQNIEANSSIFLQILFLGFNQSYISYEKEARKIGKSKWTFKKKLKLFIDSFIAFSYAPIRFVTIIGILLFTLGLIFASYLIIRQSVYGDLESGWPALISILMLGFGITNISLGILAEYLWRTLDSSRRRPVFIIDEIIDINNTDE